MYKSPESILAWYIQGMAENQYDWNIRAGTHISDCLPQLRKLPRYLGGPSCSFSEILLHVALCSLPTPNSLSRSRNSGNLLFCFGIVHSSSWKKPTSEDNHHSLLILHIRKLRPLEEEVVFFQNQVIGRSPGSQTGIGHAGILPH